MAHQSTSKHQTRANVIRLEPRIVGEDGRDIIAGCEHSEHVLYGEPSATNGRFATKDLRICDDPIE